MTEPRKTESGAKVKVIAKPRVQCWPARNAKKKFGVSVPDFRALKLGQKKGESVELLRATAEKLIKAGLVTVAASKGGK